MINKAKQLLKAETIKKEFHNKEFKEMELQVILSSGRTNGKSCFDPILNLFAIQDYKCIRIIGTKLEYSYPIQFNTIRKMMFLNGSGFLYLLSDCGFHSIDLNLSILQTIEIHPDSFQIIPIYEYEHVKSIFGVFITNGIVSVYLLNTMSKCKYTAEFEPLPCTVFIINPRNVNQILIAVNHTAHLYDICSRIDLVTYTVHSIITGCFHPLGTHLCLANTLGIHLFKREDPISFYEHHIPNIKEVVWYINQIEFFIVLTDKITIYAYEETLVPVQEIETSHLTFIPSNAYFNIGNSYYHDGLLIQSTNTTPITNNLDFENASVVLLEPSFNFLTTLMHTHKPLTYEIHYTVDICSVYDQFELLCLIFNDKVEFYQYSTCPGVLLKSQHTLHHYCKQLCVFNDFLYVFGTSIKLFTLQDNWVQLQEIPLQVTFLGLHNSLICYGDGMLHSIDCQVPKLDSAMITTEELLNTSIHISITSYPYEDELIYVYKDYYICNQLKKLLKVQDKEFIEIYEFDHFIDSIAVKVINNHVFILSYHLYCLFEESIVKLNGYHCQQLIVLNECLIGLKSTANSLDLVDMMSGDSKSIPIPLNSTFKVNANHIWIFHFTNCLVLGLEPLIEITINSQFIYRQLPKAHALDRLYSLFFKKQQTQLEESEFEQDDGFYYDCLLDIQSLFTNKSTSTTQSPQNLFNGAKNALEDRGKTLEQLDVKFNALETSGKHLLDFAKTLNRK